MKQEQEQAIRDVRIILNRHFDAWIVNYKIKDENLRSQISHDWHGDITDVIGLNRIAEQRVLESYFSRKDHNA
jgi:hypothetical protein